MRIAVNQVRQQAHFHHHRLHAVANFLARHFWMIGAQRLGNNFPDRHARIERRQRILKDHLNIATHVAPLFGLHAQ